VTNPPPASRRQPADDGEIINFRAVKNWVLFALGAARRRKWLVLGLTVLVVGLSKAALMVIPPKFQISCQLLAQKNQVLATRAESQSTSDPAQSANETVLGSENVLGLVRQTDLVKEWRARRPAALRLKDRVMWTFSGAPSDQEMTQVLADTVRDKMQVWSKDGAITFQLYWSDAEMGYRLVDAAQRSFLEARHVQEVSSLVESASILEGHAADLSKQVQTALKDLQTLREKKAALRAGPTKPQEVASRSGAPAAPVAQPASAALPDAREGGGSADDRERRLAELPVVIEAKQRIVDDLEGFRRRRMNELQAKLEEQRAIYTEAHPAVTDIKQAMAVASKESPQVTRLRGELQQLQAERERLSGVKNTPSALAVRTPGGFAAPRRPLPRDAISELGHEDRDPETEIARSKLKFAVDNYQALQERIRLTRMDLDTAQAAFKYRYVLVTPPERPRGPISPKPVPILVLALISGIVIGLVTCIALELREGTIQEQWQVEQVLALPVLTQIQLPQSHSEKPT